MLTPQLAGINKKELGSAITNLASERQEIINALDVFSLEFKTHDLWVVQ